MGRLNQNLRNIWLHQIQTVVFFPSPLFHPKPINNSCHIFMKIGGWFRQQMHWRTQQQRNQQRQIRWKRIQRRHSKRQRIQQRQIQQISPLVPLGDSLWFYWVRHALCLVTLSKRAVALHISIRCVSIVYKNSHEYLISSMFIVQWSSRCCEYVPPPLTHVSFQKKSMDWICQGKAD